MFFAFPGVGRSKAKLQITPSMKFQRQ